MTCPTCEATETKKFGKHRNGVQRFQCRACKSTFTEDHEAPFRVADYLQQKRGQLAIKLLVEGCSIRSVERVTGLRRDTVLDLLTIAGERCQALMDRLIQDVEVQQVQADEMWSFIGKKQKNLKNEDPDELGDCYTWVAIEARTKLVLAHVVGKRTSACAMEFFAKVCRATSPRRRWQLTTDGLMAYRDAHALHLHDRCDFAQLIKIYAAPRDGETRYSPAEVVEAVPIVVSGNPNPDLICTSHIERQNLTMRMQIRRLTRLTNAFSKKLDNHKAAIALHFAYYNFCQIHRTLRVTPAMESGVTDHIWTMAQLIDPSN